MTETPEIPEARCSCDPGPEGQHRYWCDTVEQPTFTASEVKELTTKATEVALALGRKEAGEEIAAKIREAIDHEGESVIRQALRFAASIAVKVASKPHQAVSNGPTASTGHSDLPPTPEARSDRWLDLNRLIAIKWGDDTIIDPTEVVYVLSETPPDLPEGRDQ